MTTPRLLGGRYEVGEVLGYGGMAEVHRGHDTRLGRAVAVKVLRSDLARDTGFQARFSREAQNSASLNHPSIVAIYDTGEEPIADGSLPYIVMEYVEGRTLREVLNAEGRLQPERALEITAEICSALEFSHRNGIVHRDIKPANVMLTRSGAVKVMDFGIARAVSNTAATMTQTSSVIGTAQYLSPEQARGETVDARSDIYSAGCLLYELLVGQPPFTGDTPVAVAYQHVREDPVPPAEHNPDVSPDVNAVVLKALAKNPANRYQSAEQMRADLVRAGTGRPVEATPVMGAAERTQIMGAAPPADTAMLRRGDGQRRGRRGWAYASLAVALIVVFALLALLGRYLVDNSTKGQQVLVPALVGKTQAAAQQEISSAGLKSQVAYVQQNDAKRDQVIDQSPPDGSRLNKGGTVKITVDQGKRKTQVPQLKGLDQGAAAQALQTAGLKAKVIGQTDPAGSNKGTVFKADPDSGQTVNAGDTVTIYVSDGTATVPDVTDKPQDQATSILQDAGFTVTVKPQRSDRSAGTVLSQTPGAGSKAAQQSVVVIVVAEATPTPASPTPPSPTPPTPPSPTPPASTPPSPTPTPPSPTPSSLSPTPKSPSPSTSSAGPPGRRRAMTASAERREPRGSLRRTS